MTIRLLCAYGKFPTNAIVMLDAATEAGLVSAKQASLNTVGGDVYFSDVIASAPVPAMAGGGPSSLKKGERTTITLPEGQVLNVSGTAGTAGVVYRLDPLLGGTNSLQSWAIGAGALSQIGPYAGTQRLLVTCSAGSVEAAVGNAVLGVKTTTQRPKSNVLSFCLGGFLGVPADVVTNPYSVMGQTVMEAPFDTVRIGIFNAAASAVTGMKVMVGAGSTLGADNGTLGLAAGIPVGGGFLVATQNGALTVDLPASSLASTGADAGNIGGTACAIGWTDWMLCNSIPRADGTSGLPTLNVILAYPAGSKRTFLQLGVEAGSNGNGWGVEGGADVAPFNRPFRAMVAATKDAVTNTAWMMVSNGSAARTYTEFPAFIVQYTLSNGYGETLLVYGDSIQEGAGASIVKCGWPRDFQRRVSTPQNPVSICNLAVSGSGTSHWLSRITSTIAGFSQASVYVPSLTPNSLGTPIVPLDLTFQRKWFSLIRQQLDRPGLMLFTSTVAPSNYAVKAYGASDTLRATWNNNLLAGGFRTADFDAAIAGPVDVNGQVTMAAAKQFDGIHPNATGYAAMAAAFIPVWQAH